MAQPCVIFKEGIVQLSIFTHRWCTQPSSSGVHSTPLLAGLTDQEERAQPTPPFVHTVLYHSAHPLLSILCISCQKSILLAPCCSTCRDCAKRMCKQPLGKIESKSADTFMLLSADQVYKQPRDDEEDNQGAHELEDICRGLLALHKRDSYATVLLFVLTTLKEAVDPLPPVHASPQHRPLPTLLTPWEVGRDLRTVGRIPPLLSAFYTPHTCVQPIATFLAFMPTFPGAHLGIPGSIHPHPHSCSPHLMGQGGTKSPPNLGVWGGGDGEGSGRGSVMRQTHGPGPSGQRSGPKVRRHQSVFKPAMVSPCSSLHRTSPCTGLCLQVFLLA